MNYAIAAQNQARLLWTSCNTEHLEKGWKKVQEASSSFPLITFLFFRALHLFFPIVLGLEVLYLYAKSTYRDYQYLKLSKEQNLLVEESKKIKNDLTVRSGQLQKAQLLIGSQNEEIQTAKTALSISKHDNERLLEKSKKLKEKNLQLHEQCVEEQRKRGLIEVEYKAAQDLGVTLGPHLRKQFEALEDAASSCLISSEERSQEEIQLLREVYLKDVLPPLKAMTEQIDRIYQQQLENLPSGNIVERIALSQGRWLNSLMLPNFQAAVSPFLGKKP